MKTDTSIETDRLILRPWTLSQEDRNFFHFIHSDPEVRRFYVTRMTRQQADEKIEQAVEGYAETDVDWGVACLKSTGEPVGVTGLGHVHYDTPFTPCVEIGWLYNPSIGGKGLQRKRAWPCANKGSKTSAYRKLLPSRCTTTMPLLPS